MPTETEKSLIKQVLSKYSTSPFSFGGGGGQQGQPDYRKMVRDTAVRIGVDPDLADAVVRQESSYNPQAMGPRTRTGEQAIGLMQLMPGTAAELGVNAFDPADNVRGGVTYLKMMLDKYGDTEKALAAYNFGPGNVDKGLPWPKETMDYTRNIMSGRGPSAPPPSPPEQAEYGPQQGVPEWVPTTNRAGRALDPMTRKMLARLPKPAPVPMVESASLSGPTEPPQEIPANAPEAAPTHTIGERLISGAVSFGRGFVSLPSEMLNSIAIAAKHIDALFGREKELDEYATRYIAKQIEDIADYWLPEDKVLKGEFLSQMLPNALGQGAGFLLGGVATESAYLFPAISGAAIGGAQAYEEATAMGAPEDAAFNAYLLNAGIGTSEALPIGNLLKRLDSETGGIFKRALIEAGKNTFEEGIQEAIQQTGGNVVAKWLYDNQRDIMDQVFISGGVGGAAGAVQGFLTTLIMGSLGGRTHALSTADPRERHEIIEDENDDENPPPGRVPKQRPDGTTPGPTPEPTRFPEEPLGPEVPEAVPPILPPGEVLPGPQFPEGYPGRPPDEVAPPLPTQNEMLQRYHEILQKRQGLAEKRVAGYPEEEEALPAPAPPGLPAPPPGPPGPPFVPPPIGAAGPAAPRPETPTTIRGMGFLWGTDRPMTDAARAQARQLLGSLKPGDEIQSAGGVVWRFDGDNLIGPKGEVLRVMQVSDPRGFKSLGPDGKALDAAARGRIIRQGAPITSGRPSTSLGLEEAKRWMPWISEGEIQSSGDLPALIEVAKRRMQAYREKVLTDQATPEEFKLLNTPGAPRQLILRMIEERLSQEPPGPVTPETAPGKEEMGPVSSLPPVVTSTRPEPVEEVVAQPAPTPTVPAPLPTEVSPIAEEPVIPVTAETPQVTPQIPGELSAQEEADAMELIRRELGGGEEIVPQETIPQVTPEEQGALPGLAPVPAGPTEAAARPWARAADPDFEALAQRAPAKSFKPGEVFVGVDGENYSIQKTAKGWVVAGAKGVVQVAPDEEIPYIERYAPGGPEATATMAAPDAFASSSPEFRQALMKLAIHHYVRGAQTQKALGEIMTKAFGGKIAAHLPGLYAKLGSFPAFKGLAHGRQPRPTARQPVPAGEEKGRGPGAPKVPQRGGPEEPAGGPEKPAGKKAQKPGGKPGEEAKKPEEPKGPERPPEPVFTREVREGGVATISRELLPKLPEGTIEKYFPKTLQEFIAKKTKKFPMAHQLENAVRTLIAFGWGREAIPDARKDTGSHSYLIADGTGTGKTLSAGLVIYKFFERDPKAKIMIVVRNEDLANQWMADVAEPMGWKTNIISRTSRFKEGTVNFITYKRMEMAWTEKTMPEIQKFAPDLLLLDESQALKNWLPAQKEAKNKAAIGSKTALSCEEASRFAKNTLFMSATPFESVLHTAYLTMSKLWHPVKQWRDWLQENLDLTFKDGYWTGLTPKKLARFHKLMVSKGQMTKSEIDFSSMKNSKGKKITLSTENIKVPRNDEQKGEGDRIGRIFQELLEDPEIQRSPYKRRLVRSIRYLVFRAFDEECKLPRAIELANQARAEGRTVVMTLFRKNDTDLEVWWNNVLQGKRASGHGKPYGEKSYMPALIQHLAANGITIKSPVRVLQKAFPNFVPITGDEVSGGPVRAANLKKLMSGEVPGAIITMAAGGTGLSAHDKIGDFPRTQINVSAPDTAGTMVQVAGRTFRLGSESSAKMYWLFGDSASEGRLAAKIAWRLREMGALVVGQETNPTADEIEQFDFPEDPAKESEEMAAAMTLSGGGMAEVGQALAEEQRGHPEQAMLDIQRSKIAPLYGWVAEHVGDIINRYAQWEEDSPELQQHYVLEKTDKTLRALKHRYGFQKEFSEQAGNDPVKLKELRRLGQVYADAHRELKPYDQMTRDMQQAAIAVGEFRFNDAIVYLERIQRKTEAAAAKPEDQTATADIRKPYFIGRDQAGNEQWNVPLEEGFTTVYRQSYEKQGATLPAAPIEPEGPEAEMLDLVPENKARRLVGSGHAADIYEARRMVMAEQTAQAEVGETPADDEFFRGVEDYRLDPTEEELKAEAQRLLKTGRATNIHQAQAMAEEDFPGTMRAAKKETAREAFTTVGGTEADFKKLYGWQIAKLAALSEEQRLDYARRLIAILHGAPAREDDAVNYGFLPYFHRTPNPEGTVTTLKSMRQMIQDLERALSTRAAVGWFRPGAKTILAHFELWRNIIRSRLYNDVEVYAHESGHRLDQLMFPQHPGLGLGSATDKQIAQFRAELLRIATQAKPGQSRTPEGFAEFVRFYLTNVEQAKKVAPNFYPWFDSTLKSRLPQIYDAFMGVRADWENMMNADPVAAIKMTIMSGAIKGNRIPKKYYPHKMYQAVVDEMAVVRNAVNHLLKLAAQWDDHRTLPGEADPRILASTWVAWPDFVETWVKRGQFSWSNPNKKIGRALLDIFKPVGSDILGYEAYAKAYEAINDLETKGWDPWEKYGVYEGWARETIKRLGPKYEGVRKEMVQFYANVVDIWVEAGLMSPRLAKKMRSKKGVFSPMWRVMIDQAMEEFEAGGAPGKRFGNLPKVTFQRHGSRLETIPSIEAAYKMLMVTFKRAEENAVALKLFELAESVPSGGRDVAAKVPEPLMPVMVKPREVLKKLNLPKAVWDELDPELMDEAIPIFRPSPFKPKAPYMYVWQKGEKVFVEWDPEVYKALNFLGRHDIGVLDKVLAPFVDALRAGAITLSPTFHLRSAIKDPWTALFQSSNPVLHAAYWIPSLVSALTHGEAFQRYKRAGGGVSTFLGIQPEDVAALAERDLRKRYDKTKYWSNPKTWAHELFGTMSYLGLALEYMPRIAEARVHGLMTAKTRGEFLKAGFAGRNVTVDFNMMGGLSRSLTRSAAFFGVGQAGIARMMREWKTRPLAAAIKFAIFGLLPALYYYLYVRDDDRWKNIPQKERDQNFIFWLPGMDEPRRIPKPHEWGVLMTIVERALQAKDAQDPKMLTQLAWSMGRNLPNPIPTGLMMSAELLANYSEHLGRPIAPTRGEYSERYWNYTSETAKGISRFFRDTPLVVSAPKIEYALRQLTGGLSTRVLGPVEEKLGLKPPSKTLPSGAQTPLIGALTYRYPTQSTDQMNRFYDRYWVPASQVYESFTGKRKSEPEDLKRYLGQRSQMLAMYYALRPFQKSLSTLREARELVTASTKFSEEEKRKKLLAILGQMDLLATKANQIAEKILGYKAPPKPPATVAPGASR